MFGRPVEGAGYVFGVEGAGLVGGLDGDEGRVGGDAVDAVGVVGGGDGAGDVRAVVVVILPGGGVLVGDAVDLAADGAGGVDAVFQVLVVGVDAGVHDGDGDLFAGHVDLLGVDRADGGEAPGVGVALVGGEVVELGVGGQAGLMDGCGLVDGRFFGFGLRGLFGADFVAGDGLKAGGSDGVVGDAGGHEALAEVGRVGGLHGLDEEGVEFGVLGQDDAVFRGARDGRVEVVARRGGGQVDRVVHDLVLGASLGGDSRDAFRVGGGPKRGEGEAGCECGSSRDEGLP